jgi:hypothetical protein
MVQQMREDRRMFRVELGKAGVGMKVVGEMGNWKMRGIQEEHSL